MDDFLSTLWRQRNTIFTVLVAWMTARYVLVIGDAAGRGPVLFIAFLLVIVTYNAYQLGQRVTLGSDEPSFIERVLTRNWEGYFPKKTPEENHPRPVPASKEGQDHNMGRLAADIIELDRLIEEERSIQRRLDNPQH
jgi:hypothetical protein